MALTTPVPYDLADDPLRALYDEICAGRDLTRPPNWAIHLGRTPHLLAAMWSLIRGTRQFHISPLLTQMLLFAVSRANGATYCVQYHGSMILQLDNQLDLDDIAGLCDGDSRAEIPEAYAVAVQVVLANLERHCSLPDEDVQRLVEVGFDEAERLEILFTAALAQMLNAYTAGADVPVDESRKLPGFRI